MGAWLNRNRWLTLPVALAVFAYLTAEAGNGFDWSEFQLAGTGERARELLAGYGGATHSLVLSLLADIGFAASYAVALAAAVAWASDGRMCSLPFFAGLGAGAFDIVENLLHLGVVGGLDNDWTTGLAAVAAVVKLALATYAVLYVIVVGFWKRIRRPARYPGVALAAIAAVLAVFTLAELDGVLQGMRTDAAPGAAVSRLASEFPWDRDDPDKFHAVDVWDDWRVATDPQDGATRAFATPESALRWHLGIDTLMFLPAYVVVLGYLLGVLRRRLDERLEPPASAWRTTWRWLLRLLAIGALADLVENGSAWVVFTHGPDASGSAWVFFTWVAFLARWVKLLGLGLVVAGGVVVAARAGWERPGTRAASVIRGASALRVPIVLLALLALAFLNLPGVDSLEQLSDVIRAWDNRTMLLALYFVAGLAMTVWVTAQAIADRVGGTERSEPRPGLRKVATALAVVVGLVAAVLWALLDPPWQPGLGLVVPGAMVVVLWLAGRPLPPLPNRTAWRRARHEASMAQEDPAIDYRIIHPAAPRFLAAGIVVVMGAAIVRTAVPQLAHTDVPFHLWRPLLGVLAVWVAVPLLRRPAGNQPLTVSPRAVGWLTALALVLPPTSLLLRGGGPGLRAGALVELGVYVCFAAFFLYYYLDRDFHVFSTRDDAGASVNAIFSFFTTGPARWAVVGLAAVVWFVLGLWLVVAPITAAPRLGATAVILLWVISFAVVAHLMGWFAERTDPPKAVYWLGLERTPMFLGLVGWLVVVGAIGFLRVDEYHDVRIVSGTPADRVALAGDDLPAELEDCAGWRPEADDRTVRGITISHAFNRWRCANGIAAPDAERREAGESVEAVPMFIVSAWGGGIRAAVWTAYALDCMFEPAPAAHDDGARPDACIEPLPGASDRLFAGSGISGGSLGLLEYAARITEPDDGAEAGDDGTTWIERRLGDDYLAPTLAHGLFVDLPLFFAGYLGAADDRAAVTERAWEASWRDDDDDGRLAQGLFDLWYRNAGVPLIVANGASFGEDCLLAGSVLDESIALTADPGDTVAGDPRLGRGSPDDCGSLLAFEDFDAIVADEAVAGSLGGLRDLANFLCPGQDVRLSTTALLSARFPFASPSGRLERKSCPGEGDVADEAVHLIDGGYTEPSGTLTADQLWQAVEPLVAEHNARAGATCIVPVMVHMENGYDPPRPPEGASEPNEWLVPAQGSGGLADTARQRAALEFSQPLRAGGLDIQVMGDGLWIENRYAFLTTRAHPGVEAPLGWTLSNQAFADLARQLDFNRPELEEIEAWLGDLSCTFKAVPPP